MKKSTHKCNVCGYVSLGYFGRCPECGAFGSMQEVVEEVESRISGKNKKDNKAISLKEVESFSGNRIFTGIKEFDRVMGGGIIRDSVSILTAKPGAGKSTLLLQVAQALSKKGNRVLYASGEESESQIKLRALRILDEMSENLFVISSMNLENIVAEAEELDIDFLIVDSIQTITSEKLQSRAGSPTQVMEVAHVLVDLAKNPKKQRAVFIVGQMTKEDELAGVRSLEHLVDTVLLIELEDNEELRVLSAGKNRYGPAGECGFFIMKEKGMHSLDDPGSYFMTRRTEQNIVPGTALCIVKEGSRYIALEVEALASKSFMAYPSRIADCLKKERLGTLVSIIEERAGIKLFDRNVVVKSSADMKLKESASNLCAIVAIVSSIKSKGLPGSSIFIGDVGLTGELKPVPFMEQRIKEARRLGFKKIYTPRLGFKLEKDDKSEIIENYSLRELLTSIF